MELNSTISNEEKEFIENLICKRKTQQMTQEELAEITGLSQAAVCRLESIKTNPTLKTIIKLLNAMDLKLVIVDKK